jgi:hypothetical protein
MRDACRRPCGRKRDVMPSLSACASHEMGRTACSPVMLADMVVVDT